LVAKKLKWNISTEPISNLNFDLCWIDGHCRQEIFARMQPYQKINHFPGMEILSRKNFLGKSLMEFRKKFPEDYDFFPITWSLPAEFNDLK
jgi:tubulin polyglutamylase TTLL6/13